jgi:L-asparagine oxygenase
MSILASKLGEQYGFKPELGGRIVQDVLPVAGVEETQQSISSNVRLEDHVEMAFSDYRSDYVGLLCIRPDHERVAATTLASIDRILPSLDSETVRILREPRFKTELDESFVVGGDFRNRIWIGPIAVLSGEGRRPRLRGDFALTLGLDTEAEAALESLQGATEKATCAVVLDAGDLVIVDNHHAFHGRTLFRARYDGRDRWLLRTFVIRDLSRTEDVRPGDGRIVDTDYSLGADVLMKEAIA